MLSPSSFEGRCARLQRNPCAKPGETRDRCPQDPLGGPGSSPALRPAAAGTTRTRSERPTMPFDPSTAELSRALYEQSPMPVRDIAAHFNTP